MGFIDLGDKTTSGNSAQGANGRPGGKGYPLPNRSSSHSSRSVAVQESEGGKMNPVTHGKKK